MSNFEILEKYSELKEIMSDCDLTSQDRRNKSIAILDEIDVLRGGEKPKKIGVVNVMINRGEGLIAECDKPKNYDSIAKANQELFNWSHTAPKNGGYDKCDFIITFEDDSEYKGRYDLKHHIHGKPCIAKHVTDYLEFLASDKNYMGSSYGDSAKEWLTQYSL